MSRPPLPQWGVELTRGAVESHRLTRLPFAVTLVPKPAPGQTSPAALVYDHFLNPYC
jgi:hypothetical protein